ncbi:MAG: RagB/SusD family nutrient uptake outer membrane protein [Bacteroidales bacterium]|nr:RagB/SusD family nutrient uptake outer membrane protein [Bacteroidales bacterium]
MKKHFILLLITGMSLVLTTSCLKDYLDKAPESGLTEDIVFTKYANFKLFFDANYNGRKYYNNGWRDTWNYKTTTPFYIDEWDQKYCINSTTDACDQGRYMEGQAWKSGNMSETIVSKLCYDGSRRPVLGACFDGIRMCNIAIRNVDRIKDADDAIKNDFSGQAYFLRAWYHFTLFRFWGPMPYLDYVMSPFDKSWDLARLPKNDYLMRIASDLDSAYYFFNLCDMIRRDPAPGVSGSLNYSAYEMYRPNGMAAMAFKSKVLLYAASPLNNKGGAADWQAAAAAAWDAIQIAESKGVILLPLLDPVSGNDRHLNFYGKDVCDESIWTRTHGNQSWNFSATWWGGVLTTSSSASGTNPTQNWVDKYETKNGWPLNTPADRAAAVAANEYKEQDPFANRDPRLATDIIYNQGPLQGWASSKAQIYYDGTTPSELLVTTWNGRSYTGYMLRKIWANNSTKNKVSSIFSDPLFRLSALYLDYAEAVNEAYGPAGTAPGSSLTAIAAINKIRTKSGMPNVLSAYTASKDAFRPRIKNERNVELSFEGQHYYDDIRRWMDLQGVMSSKLIAIIPQKTTNLVNYPTGFIYERTELPADRQPAWEEGMYYLPFLNADALKMKNFVANPVW